VEMDSCGVAAFSYDAKGIPSIDDISFGDSNTVKVHVNRIKPQAMIDEDGIARRSVVVGKEDFPFPWGENGALRRSNEINAIVVGASDSFSIENESTLISKET